VRPDAWLRCNALELTRDAVCAEHGCDVGHMAQWFAKPFPRVATFDISDAHVQLSRDRLSQLAIADLWLLPLRDTDAVACLSFICICIGRI
jgi:hypothetical protein